MDLEQIDPAEVVVSVVFLVVGAGLVYSANKLSNTTSNSNLIKGSFWVGLIFIGLASNILFDIASP